MSLIPAREILALEEYETFLATQPLSIKQCMESFSMNSSTSRAITASSIHECWTQVAGSDISQHVHVKHVKDGVLTVVADHPAWSTQLKYLQDNIVKQINAHLGGDIV